MGWSEGGSGGQEGLEGRGSGGQEEGLEGRGSGGQEEGVEGGGSRGQGKWHWWVTGIRREEAGCEVHTHTHPCILRLSQFYALRTAHTVREAEMIAITPSRSCRLLQREDSSHCGGMPHC